MNKKERGPRFGLLLTEFMKRAGIGNTALAAKLGKGTRLTIHRYRTAQAWPRPGDLPNFKSALAWRDASGVIHQLTDEEMVQLRHAAGDLADIAGEIASNSIDATEKCMVYSYRPTPTDFPHGWIRRIMELERQTQGAMHLMYNGLPTLARPSESYIGDPFYQLFAHELIRDYTVIIEERRRLFEDRITASPVRHIYSMQNVESYLRTGRQDGDTPGPPQPFRKKQVDTIISWLEGSRNFEVGLTSIHLPANLSILGSDRVLVQMPMVPFIAGQLQVLGLELSGPTASGRFREHFDYIWGSKETIRDLDDVIRWLRKNM